MPELLQNAGAAAQTIKHSIANTAERTGETTGSNSFNPSRYTYFFFLSVRLSEAGVSKALGNGYFGLATSACLVSPHSV